VWKTRGRLGIRNRLLTQRSPPHKNENQILVLIMTTARDNVRRLRSVAQPKQARSEDSLRRLLDAAESLLEERGFSEVSIADIARRARSSVGGFYARFRDKDELLLALQERFVAELEKRFSVVEAEVAADADLSALLKPSLHLLVDIYRVRRGLLTAFASRVGDNRRLYQAGMAFRRGTVERFTRLILRFREHISHPDPELAADLSVQFAIGFMEQTLTSGRVRVAGELLPEGRIEEELQRAVCAYLGVPRAG
jgi:AcrR family transcriptional regulator